MIVRAPRNEGFDRSLYKLTDGSVILGEYGLEPGDLPLDNHPLLSADGSSYPADDAIGLIAGCVEIWLNYIGRMKNM